MDPTRRSALAPETGIASNSSGRTDLRSIIRRPRAENFRARLASCRRARHSKIGGETTPREPIRSPALNETSINPNGYGEPFVKGRALALFVSRRERHRVALTQT